MNSLILRPNNSQINIHTFESVDIETLSVDRKMNIDDWMHHLILDKISRAQYKNILLPLSFGQVLSDYLGLRLSAHIRTTAFPNQCSNIFIYGTSPLESLRDNEFQQIVNTKGVKLIDYNYEDILKSTRCINPPIARHVLKNELPKFGLNIPANLHDSHSIANIWGVYRLAEMGNVDIKQANFHNFDKSLLYNIYLKWLMAKNNEDDNKEIKSDYEYQLRGPKIVGNIDLQDNRINKEIRAILIDDEAEKGWKEVIETVLLKGIPIDSVSDYASAKEKLHANKYDLIILDLRFGEQDHKKYNIDEFGGHVILKYLRSSFSNKNFPTPVFLLTASNKAWNITEMIAEGIDGFYIKEHPDTAYDQRFSRKNYLRLKHSLNVLINLGEKRIEIWEKMQTIISLSTECVSNKNIQNRIEEKLKIGYGILFRNTSKIEKHQLLFNNEVIAYIVFWSIVEEVCKDSFKNNWIKTGIHEGEMKNNYWILKNGTKFIEQKLNIITVGIKKNSFGIYERNEINFETNCKDAAYYTGKINLSLQVYALMLLYKGWKPNEAKDYFLPLNDYRNKIDFIHSSVS